VSVINNMLKDLDIRSSQFTPIEIATVGPAVTHKPGHSYAMRLRWQAA